MTVSVDYIVGCLKNPSKNHSKLKYPCGICSKNVNYNNPSIECTCCSYWVHIKCTDKTIDEYNSQIDRNFLNPELIVSEPWICSKCMITINAENFPFGLLNDSDLVSINTSNSMQINDMIPEFETISTSTKISELCSNDIDLNINNIDCKYYTNHEFSKVTNNTNDLNILHANVNGIESHFEDLQCLITDSSLDFNILCISETSQKEN